MFVRPMFRSTNLPFDECSIEPMFHSTNVPSTKLHSTKVSSTKVPQPAEGCTKLMVGAPSRTHTAWLATNAAETNRDINTWWPTLFCLSLLFLNLECLEMLKIVNDKYFVSYLFYDFICLPNSQKLIKKSIARQIIVDKTIIDSKNYFEHNYNLYRPTILQYFYNLSYNLYVLQLQSLSANWWLYAKYSNRH